MGSTIRFFRETVGSAGRCTVKISNSITINNWQKSKKNYNPAYSVSLRLQMHPPTDFQHPKYSALPDTFKALKNYLICTQNTYVFSLCSMIKLYLRNHQKSFQQLLIQYYKDIILSIKILIRYIVWWVLICHYWLLRRGHTQHKNHMKYICLLYKGTGEKTSFLKFSTVYTNILAI